jgi:putative N6-adenine-specific DNA methylase
VPSSTHAPALPFTCFAVAAPGLEPFTAQELERLGLTPLPGFAPPLPSPEPLVQERGEGPGVRGEAGGVEFPASLHALYRANLHLRTASRVLVRLGMFYAAAFSELRKKADRLPWERYLLPGQPVALRVTCHKSRLYHSGAVAERVAGAIEDHLGRPSPYRAKGGDDETPENPEAQLIVVRLVHDQCTISVDSSGALLHRRGYRLATAKAPLRETLAAGMLFASGWDMASPLLDPFCGSGTIAIEAALMARNIPPGRGRRFAFMDWPGFDAALWQSLLEHVETRDDSPRSEAERDRASLPMIIASDRDAGAIAAAQANAARAGVADGIKFSRRAVSAIEPPSQPGWVVTNPPYGVRASGNKDLRNLYAQFGHVLRARCPGWHVAMLSGSAQLAKSVGLDFDEGLPLVNGGLKVRLMRASV